MHDTYSTKPGIVDIEIHYCKVLILRMECDKLKDHCEILNMNTLSLIYTIRLRLKGTKLWVIANESQRKYGIMNAQNNSKIIY